MWSSTHVLGTCLCLCIPIFYTKPCFLPQLAGDGEGRGARTVRAAQTLDLLRHHRPHPCRSRNRPWYRLWYQEELTPPTLPLSIRVYRAPVLPPGLLPSVYSLSTTWTILMHETLFLHWLSWPLCHYCSHTESCFCLWMTQHDPRSCSIMSTSAYACLLSIPLAVLRFNTASVIFYFL